MRFIHITTGDLDGVGLEVALKALSKTGPIKGTQFVLWRPALAPKEMLPLLNKQFKQVTIKTTKLLHKSKTSSFLNFLKLNHSALYNKYKTTSGVLWDLALLEQPTHYVLRAGHFCLKNPRKEVLLTGPLSKTQMQKEGFKERGHTGLLQKISGAPYVYMCFLGEYFNVTLLTGHIPLKKVAWSQESLNHCIKLCLNMKNHLLPLRKKIGVLGLNPHAGEAGLLGTEEITLKTTLNKWPNQVEGPLVPDTAFFKKNWPRFFMYICLYHDQGLIPFKMIHGQKSFQLSLGLPFTRVSVSHGTAKDIYGQNKADPESMAQALLWIHKGFSQGN